jgi:hypothetical protein
MVYDIGIPHLVRFAAYQPAAPGDIAPEGLVFIDAANSPVSKPLLVVSHEDSGTVSVYLAGAKAAEPVPAAAPLGIGAGALGLLGFALRRRLRG